MLCLPMAVGQLVDIVQVLVDIYRYRYIKIDIYKDIAVLMITTGIPLCSSSCIHYSSCNMQAADWVNKLYPIVGMFVPIFVVGSAANFVRVALSTGECNRLILFLLASFCFLILVNHLLNRRCRVKFQANERTSCSLCYSYLHPKWIMYIVCCT